MYSYLNKVKQIFYCLHSVSFLEDQYHYRSFSCWALLADVLSNRHEEFYYECRRHLPICLTHVPQEQFGETELNSKSLVFTLPNKPLGDGLLGELIVCVFNTWIPRLHCCALALYVLQFSSSHKIYDRAKVLLFLRPFNPNIILTFWKATPQLCENSLRVLLDAGVLQKEGGDNRGVKEIIGIGIIDRVNKLIMSIEVQK